MFVATVALLSALGGGLATTAFGQGPPFAYWHGGFRGGWMDSGNLDQHIERGIKHLAIEIDASKEQQDKLIGIAKALAKDVQPLREKLQSTRKQAIDLFAQSTVDRAAIEKLRADQLATADELTRKISKAIADAAEVMTPEQRKTIVDRLPPFGGWHGRWHRG
jgi:Spy/CpxP family protein refolding chaperone